MKGYNLIELNQVSTLGILFDGMNFLSYFSCFMGTFAMECYVSYLSLHLKNRYKFADSDMGYMFSLSTCAYLPACVLVPYVLAKVPPKV